MTEPHMRSSPLIAERLGDADIAVINKTPISKETIDKPESERYRSSGN